MNLQLANVISDISGLTGQAIVRAIVGGERNPRKLAAFRDPRIQASEEEIAKSLEGQLASGTVVCVAAGTGDVRPLPAADGRV
jgi:hypothetical protein